MVECLVPRSAPRLLTVASFQPTLSWKAPDIPNGVITQYEVEYRRSNDTSWNAYNISSRTTGNTLFGTTERLLPDIKYSLRVRAYTRAGAGPLGDALTASVVSYCKLLCVRFSYITSTEAWGILECIANYR